MIRKLIVTTALVVSFCNLFAQEVDEDGYRFLKRIRGMKLVESQIEEIKIDESSNNLAISYRSKKMLYLSVLKLFSWDKINDYRLDGRIDLSNSYFSNEGKEIFVNIDIYKQLYLKIDLQSGEADTLECAQTPEGCQQLEQSTYGVRKYSEDKMYLFSRDKEHPNDLLIYIDQKKFSDIKEQMEKDAKRDVLVTEVKERLENDARKRYGVPIKTAANTTNNQNGSAPKTSTTTATATASTPKNNAKPKASIIISKDDILQLIETGSFERGGVTFALDDDVKIDQIVEEQKKNAKANGPKNGAVAQSKQVAELTKGGALQKDKFEVGEVIKLSNILFEQGKSALKPDSFTELDKLVDVLMKNSGMQIQVNGHTNNIGVQNLEVSEARAKAVVDYLVTKGVAADRLKYKGYGDTQPIASNDSEDGRALNRRVEFIVIKK